MLRNRGVNVTERRIRQDLLRAYEYDIFDVRPRWRCMHEAGCRGPDFCYRQPRYCTTRCTRPLYFHTASSATSYGVKRVYLPDEDWGAGSAESTVYVRNPRYNMRSYYPNEALSRERPYRSDLRYEGYYSRRPSSMYIDDDDYCPNWHSRYTDRKLVRKVTKKLSPIFTCDCATASNVRQLKKNNKNNNKVQHSDLSKEAKELSLDIFKIISLLQKADGEDDEQFSSVSLLQNIHNLDCHSSNSIAKLVTQRVNVCQKMERQKQDDPLTKFKTASGVRSKLEALVDALKQYEAEKYLSRANSSNYGNKPKYKNIIPSDPPSLEVRSFSNGKDLKSSTYINAEKQKDIVLQTEEPTMSNKSVYGKVKLKKEGSSAERKSLRSRLSWRKKESSGIKMRRDRGNERFTDKNTERKRSFFCKMKSKSRIRPIIESEQSQSEKKYAAKQGQTTNKAGLMIQIGGSPQRKSASLEKDKTPRKEKMPKTWIRKFLEDKKDTKNNIRIRWANKAFYTKSSSTIFELVNSVYKQMGINKSKSDVSSISKHNKTPKRTTHKHSNTRMQTSSKKPKHKQKIETYMMHQIIVPGPVYTPILTNLNKVTEKLIPKPREKLYEFPSNFYSGLNTSELSINYFEIQLPKNFFDPGSMSEELTSDKQEHKIIEYEPMKTNTFKDTLIDYLNGMGVDQECALSESIKLNDSEDLHSEDVVQVSNSLYFPKNEDGEENLTRKEPESEPTKSKIQIQKFINEESGPQFFPRSSCSLAEEFLREECLNWMPMSSDSLLWSANYEELDKVSIIHDDVSIKTDIDNAAESISDDYTQNKLAPKDSKDVNRGRKFNAVNNNFVQWKNRATATFSESIVGIYSRKPVVLSVFWSLFKLLKKGYSKSKISPPLQDLSLVEPPGTASQPECSYKSQNLILTRKPLRSQKQQLLFEPLRLAQLASAALEAKKEVALVIPTLIRKSLCSIQFDDLAEDESEVEKREISLSVSLVESTDESEKALMFSEPPDTINVESAQPMIPDETKDQKETISTPRKPLCLIRLVRSVHDNLQTERNIKPRAVRSVLLLEHQTHPIRSQLLLFVRPIFNGQAEIGQTLDKYKQSVEPQPTKPDQCLSASSKCDLQNVQLASADENRALKETINNSQDIIKIENNPDIVVQKLSLNITSPVEVCSKEEKTEMKKVQNIDNCEKCEFRDTIRYRKTKKNKQLTYVTQMPKIKSSTCPSDIPSILDKNAAMQFSVEVTKGNKVTKISIMNRKSNKENNIKSTNLRISQAPLITNNAEPIKQSTKGIPKKNIKVCINIRNINAQEAESGGNVLNKSVSNHVSEKQIPKKEADDCQVVAAEHKDLNDTIDDAADSQRCSVYKSHSLPPFTECSQIDDMSGMTTQRNYMTKSQSERRIRVTDFNDPFVPNEKSSISLLHDIAAEDYVNEILGTTDKIDPAKLKKVVEMRRTLKAMMMLNVSSFAEMALMHELASDHNDTYTSLSQQLKRRKKIVSILSEINIRNIRTDYLKQQAVTINANCFDDSESIGTCSFCNMLARKQNSHRCVEIDMATNFKGDIAANYYVPHLASPVMPPPLELDELLSCLKEEHLFNNSDTFINRDDTGAMLMDSILHSKRNTEEIMQEEAKPICWCCVKNMNKRSKKKHSKKWKTKKHINISNSYQNDAIILVNTDSYNSQNPSFTEYKVRFKNDDPMLTDDSVEKLFSGGNKSDILQSCKIKKAVLQIYSDETVENGDYLFAKLPKYLRL